MTVLPQDLASLLAVAIRDVIWFKDRVLSFLDGCNVPAAIMVDVRRMSGEKVPTIKLVHHVLSQLSSRGDEGVDVGKQMLTQMHYWKDLHTVPADRKDQAVKSLKALQDGVTRYKSQESSHRDQREREKEMHREREQRCRMSDLDHAKLAAFRVEFDRVFALQDPQDRGNKFQDLMNKVFNYYCEKSKGDFKRTGEQIDGQFLFDKHWWYVEVRWTQEQAQAKDVSVLRDRAKSAFGGDTKALFISFNGFTSECLEALRGQTDERVVLMDGLDLRYVLDCQIAFDLLLAEKQAEMVRSKRPFVGVQEIMRMRSQEVRG